MPNDPIRAALLRDAQLLAEQGPRPNAAGAWHAMRAVGARRLHRIINACVWTLRMLVLTALAALTVVEPDALVRAAPPALLILWLTRGLAGKVNSPRPPLVLA